MNLSIRTGLYSDQAKNDLMYLLNIVNNKYPAVYFRVVKKIDGEFTIEENSLIFDRESWGLAIITAPSNLYVEMPISISSSNIFTDESLLWIIDDLEYSNTKHSVVRFPERLAFLIDFLRNDMPIDELAKKHETIDIANYIGCMRDPFVIEAIKTLRDEYHNEITKTCVELTVNSFNDYYYFKAIHNKKIKDIKEKLIALTKGDAA